MDRTDLAEDRTLLANERTFASWMRTGLGAVGVGLGLNALFRTMEPLWIAKAISTGFVLVGVFIFWAAERRACRVEKRLHAHEVKPFETHRLRVIAYAMSLASLVLVIAIWVLV